MKHTIASPVLVACGLLVASNLPACADTSLTATATVTAPTQNQVFTGQTVQVGVDGTGQPVYACQATIPHQSSHDVQVSGQSPNASIDVYWRFDLGTGSSSSGSLSSQTALKSDYFPVADNIGVFGSVTCNATGTYDKSEQLDAGSTQEAAWIPPAPYPLPSSTKAVYAYSIIVTGAGGKSNTYVSPYYIRYPAS